MAKGKEKTCLEIRGQIERITYSNAENGYTVAKMKVQGRADLVSVVGTLLSVTPGEILKLTGYWDVHPRFGSQFKIVSSESVMPATAAGIQKYLGSGMIKGIGPVMARRLVARFGDETLNVIEQKIDRLQEVEGIGEKRIEMIRAAWDEQRDIRDVMVFLQGHGITPAYAAKIYRQYGKDATRIVRDNPYRLATDVFGIGFLTADRIAGNLGIPKDSEIRAEAGILYVLNQLADEGHLYYPRDPLQTKCAEILDIETVTVKGALDRLRAEGKVVIEEEYDGDGRGESGDRRPVYLAGYHVAETGVAERMGRLIASPKQLRLVNIDDAIAWAQKLLKIRLSEFQAEAVRSSINSKCMVITGGPGTGKTTIINAIIRIYEKTGQKVLLAAPTGRAAKRMSETTGHEAKTLHRLLEFGHSGGSGGRGGFKRNGENPLDGDLVIIDEASMVDTVLMYHFLKAVPDKATLILVGDVDQLPSVGPGNVLKDIIESRSITTVRLTEIFRQSKESAIIVNAHRINDGQMPILGARGEGLNDFRFYEVEDPEKALETIVSLCKERIPAELGYDPVNDIQVLTPMHRGTTGVTNLNMVLQGELNPGGEELIRAGRTYRVGDKVMQIRNNYDKDVYNGDIGRILAIDQETQEVLVDVEGRQVTYEFADLDELIHAYAASVHKAQGSEYPVVILPIMTQHYMLLQRNLLYTGVTRGKRLVVLVGTKKAIAIAVKNNKQQQRFTLLRERLSRL